MNITKINKIVSCHGYHEVCEHEEKYYLILPDYDGDYYQEIPYTLYLELLAYEKDSNFNGESVKDDILFEETSLT